MGTHKMYRSSFMGRWTMLVISLLLLIGGGSVWIMDDRPEPALPNPVIGRTTPSETVLPQPLPTATSTPSALPTTKPVRTRPFVPTTVSVAQVGSRPVQSLGRITVGENGFSLPDPEGLDPQVYAWDREGAKPGSERGAVNLTAHTYPPGQEALGNQLYSQLQIGDMVIVRGQGSSLRYQVTERLEVALANYPSERVLDRTGAPHLTITVCSGERRGPGDWTMRTVWIAAPMK